MGPLIRLILGLGALVLILAAVALGLPAHVTVSRSVVINAPEHAIYPYLDNLRRFPDWSPWSARDPKMKVNFSGPPEGKGAKIEWASEEPSIGAGSMEIIATAAISPQLVPVTVTNSASPVVMVRAFTLVS